MIIEYTSSERAKPGTTCSVRGAAMQQIEWLDKLGLGQSPTLNAPVGAACSFGIFAILLAIYVLSPINTSGDSRWSLHTAMSLVRGHAGESYRSTRRPFNETASTRSDMSTAGRALIFRSGFRSSPCLR